jgi:hypothetical protein
MPDLHDGSRKYDKFYCMAQQHRIEIIVTSGDVPTNTAICFNRTGSELNIYMAISSGLNRSKQKSVTSVV